MRLVDVVDEEGGVLVLVLVLEMLLVLVVADVVVAVLVLVLVLGVLGVVLGCASCGRWCCRRARASTGT